MSTRWQGKQHGRWIEQEPLACDLKFLLAAREAVSQKFAEYKAKNTDWSLGFCARTFAVQAAQASGCWPQKLTGFDEILLSYALYQGIKIYDDKTDRWRALGPIYEE